MPNKKAEQRKASNRRILDSALTEFSQKGFARALLGNIARSAGVSNGMITQRFGGKENLYYSVFVDLITKYLEELDDENGSMHSMLTKLVDDIKYGAATKTERFLFVYDLLISRDSPVDSFDQVRDLFEGSALCRRMKEAMDEGLLNPEPPFELIRSFLISALGITKIYSDSAVALPDTDGYMSLLMPREKMETSSLDVMRSRFTDELIGQLSSEYEHVMIFNLETSRMSVGVKKGLFLSLLPPDPSSTFDEKSKRFAEQAVHPDDREMYIEFLKTDRLLKEFVQGKIITLKFRTIGSEVPNYQATVRFNRVDSEGHWVTLGIKNLDWIIHDKKRSEISLTEDRISSFASALSDSYSFIAWFDRSGDKISICRAEGLFREAADKIPEKGSGREFLRSFLSSMIKDGKKEEILKSADDLINGSAVYGGKVKVIAFTAAINVHTFRCLLSAASPEGEDGNVMIGIMDMDRNIEEET